MSDRRIELCVDCSDASVVLPWWTAALGWDVVDAPGTDDGSSELAGPAGMRVWFQRVPERKTVKNRLHLDVYVPAGDVPALQARLVDELGGSVVDASHERFVVLADPEGNELCLCWD